MSRSYRKNPIVRQCGKGGSEKYSKRLRSSRERRIVRDKLRLNEIDLLHFQQIRWDEWSTARDGKYILDIETLREYPELIKELRK